MNFTNSIQLQQKFNHLIPGGCHTYAKGDDQYPEFMPVYMSHGKGSHVWDVDGNEYIEYGMGLRSVTLGHAFEPVVTAAINQMWLGNNFVRPAKLELDYAEEFLSLIDSADMVKFCKDGSDATNGAVKLARAYTNRDMVAVCGSHPFFSVDDWFIGSTPMAGGIPEVVRNLTVKFQYNDLESVQRLFDEYPNKISCVILEAQKVEPPKDNFLHKLKELCHKHGVVFILDEMITGFRWHLGGAQKKFNIEPDLCTFGKAMGNGIAISALAGKRELMELGGQFHNKERVFLISTTHGAEHHALAAGLAVIKYYKEHDVIGRMYEQGRKLEEGVNAAAFDLNIQDKFGIIGPHCCSVYFTKDQDGKPSQPFRTLFIQETMKRGLLMPSSIVSYAHSDDDINQTIEKIHEALVVYNRALNEGIEKYLVGKSVQPVFRKYNH
ncbi:MAG TPA: glutamate-1-semialdehyde 2,1-aminomutase [Anaerolineaceae bacterium]|nr:glutamate-1-semialdehyde 2,1-aminomutase [Anaerolineaceae bacterium]